MNVKIMCERGSTIQSRVLRNVLVSNGINVVKNNPDYVIIVGNDNTFLKSIRSQKYDAYPIYVGLNCGDFGYFQNISFNNLNSLISFIKENEYLDKHVDFISIAKASYVFKSGKVIKDNYVKDFKIQADSTMQLSISDGNGFRKNLKEKEVEFNTKYNLNKKAMLMDSVDAIYLSSSNENGSSIIGSRFEVKVKSGDAKIIEDGQKLDIPVENIKKIILEVSNKKITRLNLDNKTYGDYLTEKLTLKDS